MHVFSHWMLYFRPYYLYCMKTFFFFKCNYAVVLSFIISKSHIIHSPRALAQMLPFLMSIGWRYSCEFKIHWGCLLFNTKEQIICQRSNLYILFILSCLIIFFIIWNYVTLCHNWALFCLRECLLIDPQEHPMLLAEPSSNTQQQRERWSSAVWYFVNWWYIWSVIWHCAIIINLFLSSFRIL